MTSAVALTQVAPPLSFQAIRRVGVGATIVGLLTAGVAVCLMACSYRAAYEVIPAEVVGAQLGANLSSILLQAEIGDTSNVAIGEIALVVLDGEPASAAVIGVDAHGLQLAVLLHHGELPRSAELHIPRADTLSL